MGDYTYIFPYIFPTFLSIHWWMLNTVRSTMDSLGDFLIFSFLPPLLIGILLWGRVVPSLPFICLYQYGLQNIYFISGLLWIVCLFHVLFRFVPALATGNSCVLLAELWHFFPCFCFVLSTSFLSSQGIPGSTYVAPRFQNSLTSALHVASKGSRQACIQYNLSRKFLLYSFLGCYCYFNF